MRPAVQISVLLLTGAIGNSVVFVLTDIALQKGYEHKRKKAFNRARGVKCQSWFHFFAVWKEIGTNTKNKRSKLSSIWMHTITSSSPIF
ncbi:hypothetical protein AB3S75_037566 [Citrus x aurantiifolia]